jgi:hypothetical protein
MKIMLQQHSTAHTAQHKSLEGTLLRCTSCAAQLHAAIDAKRASASPQHGQVGTLAARCVLRLR